MNEIRLCATLEHPKIVKFVGISWSTLQDLTVLSEFMPHGDLTQLLRNERKKAAHACVFHWMISETPEHECANQMSQKIYHRRWFPASKTSVATDIADALVYLHSFEPTVPIYRYIDI